MGGSDGSISTKMKPVGELRDIFTQAGFDFGAADNSSTNDDRRVVVSCGSGLTACVVGHHFELLPVCCFLISFPDSVFNDGAVFYSFVLRPMSPVKS
jgi:hypothetical protein